VNKYVFLFFSLSRLLCKQLMRLLASSSSSSSSSSMYGIGSTTAPAAATCRCHHTRSAASSFFTRTPPQAKCNKTNTPAACLPVFPQSARGSSPHHAKEPLGAASPLVQEGLLAWRRRITCRPQPRRRRSRPHHWSAAVECGAAAECSKGRTDQRARSGSACSNCAKVSSERWG
jgi:hypothetical protein